MSDATGHFAVAVPPGTYVISYGTCKPKHAYGDRFEERAVVQAGKWTELRLQFWDGTRCLDGRTPIDTPAGAVPVARLRPGAVVSAVDRDGRDTVAIVAATRRSAILPGQKALRITLGDGRTLTLSPAHPLADGHTPGELAPGDSLAGSVVIVLEPVDYWQSQSYDIRLEPPGLAYRSRGITVRSTME